MKGLDMGPPIIRGMKQILIYPGALSGALMVPPSKSICHRAMICGSLSSGTSNIYNVQFSDDIDATCSAAEDMGVKIKRSVNALEIKGPVKLDGENILRCNESASTLRFLIPLAAVFGKRTTFEGGDMLSQRPLKPYYDIFDAAGISYWNNDGKLPLTVEGRLLPGEYKIEGGLSSQFITGMLFALPLLDGDSKLIVKGSLKSKPYVDLTVDMIKKFNVYVQNKGYNEFIIEGNQKYTACDVNIEGDFSQGAFFLAADVLGSRVECRGLNMGSIQGDKAIIDIIEGMGGHVHVEGDSVMAIPSDTKGITVDVSQCPDLMPVIAVLGSLSKGITRIVNAGRLRYKESDRLTAITDALGSIGADIMQQDDGLVINGKDMLEGGAADSWNDHRIAMALAVASTRCKRPVVLNNPYCVKKSYPDFWDDFNMLGGSFDERSVG